MESTELSHTQLAQFKKICTKAGIKVTHQRLEIFRELMAGNDHPSAEDIHHRLVKTLPTIAIDTVYRTLATFSDLGLVKKLHLMNERTLFDANTDQHHHFICTRCKTVKDLHWHDFDRIQLPQTVGKIGHVHSRHLELHGLCATCLNKPN